MRKAIRILEVPIYLLVLSLLSFEDGSNGIGSFLMIVSLVRLWLNSITDNSVYK